MTVKPESAVKKFCFGAGRIPGGPSLLSLLSCPSSFPHVTTVGPRAPQSVYGTSVPGPSAHGPPSTSGVGMRRSETLVVAGWWEEVEAKVASWELLFLEVVKFLTS